MAERTYATIYTNMGPIRVELFPNYAPKTVRNFRSRSIAHPRILLRSSGVPSIEPGLYTAILLARLASSRCHETPTPADQTTAILAGRAR